MRETTIVQALDHVSLTLSGEEDKNLGERVRASSFAVSARGVERTRSMGAFVLCSEVLRLRDGRVGNLKNWW